MTGKITSPCTEWCKQYFDPKPQDKHQAGKIASYVLTLGLMPLFVGIVYGCSLLHDLCSSPSAQKASRIAKNTLLGTTSKGAPPFTAKTPNKVFAYLRAHPQTINDKVDYGEFKQVLLSHLICSGKLFTAPSSANITTTLQVLQLVKQHINLALIDDSNLWAEESTQEKSDCNVLKTALYGSSNLVLDGSRWADIAAFLFGLLNDSPGSKNLLNNNDLFKEEHSRSIATLLAQQGRDDLALKALDIGADITEDLLLTAVASAGTTQHELALVERVMQHYIDQSKPVSKETHWRLRACLLPPALHKNETLCGKCRTKEYSLPTWVWVHDILCAGYQDKSQVFSPFADLQHNSTDTLYTKRDQFILDHLVEWEALIDLFNRLKIAPSFAPNFTATTPNEVFAYVKQNPTEINSFVNYKSFKGVALSHLICSGRMFTNPRSKDVRNTHTALMSVYTHIDFTLIDTSNLYEGADCFKKGTVGSGFNVLKAAACGASPMTFGAPIWKDVAQFVLNILDGRKRDFDIENILNSGDNLKNVTGLTRLDQFDQDKRHHVYTDPHSIPVIFALQHNNALATRALDLGAAVSDLLLFVAIDSAGTGGQTLTLASRVIQHYMDSGKTITEEMQWELRACLQTHHNDALARKLATKQHPYHCPQFSSRHSGMFEVYCHTKNRLITPFISFYGKHRPTPSESTQYYSNRDYLVESPAAEWQKLCDLFQQLTVS